MKEIPMLDLRLEYEYMKEDIDSAIKKCLEHQKWILGPEVRELEEKISDYIGVRHCVGVSSGTDALVLSLRALAIKIKGEEYFDRNDKIITTPFTFTATGDAILRAGATPVFVDIDPKTFNIDPERVEEVLKTGPGKGQSKIRGILPVHLYGLASDMDKIMPIAKKYNLFVLEDVAQAFGGSWDVKKLGSIGDLGAFSFFPSKNLGGFGDGGMIATNDQELAEMLRILLKHGGRDKYNVDHIGYNARLDTLQAAVLLAKFRHLDEFNEKRRRIAKSYDEGLSALKDLTLPVSSELAEHVYHQYTVVTAKRDALQKYLQERKISTMVYYLFPLHKMRLFANGKALASDELRNSEKASQNVLSLPIEPLQREEDTNYVIKCLSEFHF